MTGVQKRQKSRLEGETSFKFATIVTILCTMSGVARLFRKLRDLLEPLLAGS